MPNASTMTSAALLLLGSIVAGYWYRVMRMAAKARRRTGRAANLWPPERLGRALRLLWGPIITIWVIHPLISAFAKNPLPCLLPLWPVFDSRREVWAVQVWIVWGAAIVAAACLAATAVCWKRMGANWRMGIDPAETTSLVASGPFAYVRHPIYALSAFMMLATVIALPSPLMLAAAVIHLGLLYWESSREEKYLLLAHGSVYEHYRAHVGRFIPVSVRPYSASKISVAKPSPPKE